jgi:hypothetical protein
VTGHPIEIVSNWRVGVVGVVGLRSSSHLRNIDAEFRANPTADADI